MRRRHLLAATTIVAALTGLEGCRTPSEAASQLDKVQVCIQSQNGIQPVTAELAVNDSQRRKGLMGRESLAPDHGMLFVYQEPRPPEATFWMYHTFIPLDIAYISEAGDIRAIRRMLPCTADDPDRCPQYPAGVRYTMALEMPQGYFRSNGIREGHRVDVLETPNARCPDPAA
ncbi:DUF192 domain-containing protein [Marinobacter halodurans]|uniref:DUF192 domain-containing protein n=1 Tax=Marinobacter halodurans TaxID=2528979 RepID=A0ABY1ZJA1_9GAMM|nr:DUF192 domain-containing protein [Marinobacter halodurans]TBW49503.1 DUF192 domain-containing protein [Marinobacter halodurans]